VCLTVFSSDHYLVSLERKYRSTMILRKIWRGKNTTTDQQQRARAHKKHQHHESPRPPASSGFKLIGKFDRRTSRDRPRSPQCCYVFLIDYTNFSFIYLTINLCAAAQCAH
jgi:hypothetical protein